MPLPVPEPGLVVSYSYLWHSEYEQNQEEGLKDRPCAIILIARGAAGRGPRPSVWLGAADTLGVREQAAVGGLGVASARERRANSAEAAIAAAAQLEFPVALKLDSPDARCCCSAVAA